MTNNNDDTWPTTVAPEHIWKMSAEDYDAFVAMLDEPPNEDVVASLRRLFEQHGGLFSGEPRPSHRIEKFLAVLEIAWSRQPDLRFGQLVYNALLRDSDKRTNMIGRLFNVEDDEALALMQAHAKEQA